MTEGVHISCNTPASCLGEGVVPCDVPCEWSLNAINADAEVSGILGGAAAQSDTPGSKQVIWSMEAQTHYSRLNTAEEEVNRTTLLGAMLMHFTSPNPMPYFSWNEYDLQDKMPGYAQREKAVLFVARNCASQNGREDVVRSLQANGVRVDSVSSCLNNKPWPSDIENGGPSTKHLLLQRYLLYFAAENCNEVDYVTEKAYGPLAAGTPLLYLGAPNIDEFVPPNSVMSVPTDRSDANMKEFAAKVQGVMNDQAKWEAMVAWRSEPLPEWFKRKFSFTCSHSSCRLCRYVYARKHNLPWNHELQRVEFPGYATTYQPKVTFLPGHGDQ